MTIHECILNKDLGTTITGTAQRTCLYCVYVCAWMCVCVLLCQSMCVAQPVGMQVQLVIYTLFTDTQFTTKTKQINISLNSGQPLIRPCTLAYCLWLNCMVIIFQESGAHTSRPKQNGCAPLKLKSLSKLPL